MRKHAVFRSAALATMMSAAPAAALPAQETAAALTSRTLTLAQAREMARSSSPELVAGREALAAATARERQAGAFPNPVLAYSHERTSAGGLTNSQHIATLEQPLELAGQRGARKSAAGFQQRAAEARLSAAEARLAYEVARAYARAIAAERRAALIERIAGAFTKARRVGEVRLTGGDISGYENRRLRLEAARYVALRAEALTALRTA